MLNTEAIEGFANNEIDQLGDRLRLLVKGRHRRQNLSSGFGQTQQVLQMNLVERGLARHKQ